MVVNGDGPQPAEMFPGIRTPGTTGAGGSAASRTPPPDRAVPDSDSGQPSGMISPLSAMTIDGRSASPELAGQLGDSTPITPGTADDYGDSGAGHGHNFADQFRYPWQSKPGRNG